MPASLYIHVPFCARKCAYCDFASYPGRLHLAEPYLARVLSDMDEARAEYGPFSVPTVYIGGGTPSLMTPDWIARLLDHARRAFSIEDGAEISMEANPGTVTEESLRGYRQAGVNRLSLGVQSSSDRLLKAIGRIHTRAQAEQAVVSARRAGFENVSLDLMYGLPGQSADDFAASVEWALARDVEHLSLYSLILEEGTPLYESGVCVPGEDEVLSMQRRAIDLLSRSGYERYEISNYARPGYECRHNQVYWFRGDYLGLGCAAHSLMRGQRYAQPRSLDEYLSAAPVARETLTPEDERVETLMLGLRTREGIPASFVNPREAARLSPYLEIAHGRARLTPLGMEVMDEVVRRLL